ncbi:Enterobactin synthase component F [Halomonadaceae bacterium LMG 33818]|uniref:amino acid adenylation domain-containing protein n=1 Tax=Cernens ardua TaxID=3402176 RepID=UPI003EDC5B8A
MSDTSPCAVETSSHNSIAHRAIRLPLTESQSGIWYGLQLSDYPRAYLTAQAIHIKEKPTHGGTLNEDCLKQAIQKTLNDAPILHTRFESDANGPYQNTNAPSQGAEALPTPHLQVLTFTRKTPSTSWLCKTTQEALAPWQWMQQRLLRPLDIASPALAESALLALQTGSDSPTSHLTSGADNVTPNAREWLWYLSAHHLQLDAYSYTLLVEYMWRQYHALISEDALPNPCFGNISEVVIHEQAYLDSVGQEEDRFFWHSYLLDAPNATTLASRFAKAKCAPIRHHAQLNVAFPSNPQTPWAIWAHLPEQLLATIGSYLSRCVQQHDILLNVPMMGRSGAGLRTPVSMVNTLPLRLKGSEDASFNDWLRLTQEGIKDIKQHQRYRHEWLSRELQRLPGESPLASVQVNIVLQPPGMLPDGIETEIHHLSPGPVNDLTFNIYWMGERQPLRVMVEANPDLYSPLEVELHTQRLQAWIATLSAQPDTPISLLPLATREEAERIAQWNDTSHFIASTDLVTLFHQQVKATPNAEALVFGEHSLTYSALYRHVNALSHLLEGMLADHDETQPCVVAVAMPRSLALPIAMLAIQHCGAAYLPLPMDQPAGRWKRMLEVADARYAIVCPAYHDALPANIISLPLDDDALLATCVDDRATEAPSYSHGRLLEKALAYVLFTSGSTGEPKGVMIEHGAIVNRLLWMQDTFPIGAGDRVLQKTPYGFDVSVWEFFWPLISGATLVMAAPDIHRDPNQLANLILSERITTLHFVPSMLSLFLDELVLTRKKLPQLKHVFASGEALNHETVKRFVTQLGHHSTLINLYGPTEAAVDVTSWPCKIEEESRSIPIGSPIWNTRIDIRSPQGLSQPIGITGELYIHGKNLARGYINRPELTEKSFLIDSDGSRWYRTGDMARWNTEGEIEYLGRVDHQIKLNGQRLEPGEIEAVLVAHPKVMHATVIVHDNRLVGYVQIDSSMGTEWQHLLADYLKQWLPPFMVPSLWVALETLPLSPNGKLDRKALPLPVVPVRQETSENNSTDPIVLTTLCTLFGESLNQSPFSPDEDFFMRGGDSLSAVKLAMSIRQNMEKEVSIATVFAASTPASMMKELSRDTFEGALDHTLTLGRSGGESSNDEEDTSPSLYCFHPAGGLSWCYAHIAQWLNEAHNIIGIQARGLHDGEHLPTSFEAMAEDYVNTLCARQPKGPYRLMGWSLGGMLTHQIAALLQRQGATIELIAMLDTYPGDVWKDTPIPDEATSLIALLRIAGMTLPEGEALERHNIIRLLAKRQHALATLSPQTIDRVIDIVVNSSRIVREAHHLTYKGDVLFFRATQEQQSSAFTPEAWQPYVDGKIHCIDLPTDHAGIVRPDMLMEIARHINQWYER